MSSYSEEWSDDSNSQLSLSDCENQEIDQIQEQAFHIISEPQLIQKTLQKINDLSDKTGLATQQSMILLNKNNWEVDTTAQVFMDGRSNSVINISNQQATIDPNQNFSCMLCFGNYQGSQMAGLACMHLFCVDCYSFYVTDLINQGKKCFICPCPYHECNFVMPDQLIQSLVSTENFRRYRKFVSNQHVENCSHMKWCPNPKCSQIVIVTRAVDDSITCACQHEFCFSCNDESHYPLDCDSLKEWNRVIGKNVDDPNQFLGANTKQCPKCKAGIEKNQGCMHMTCLCGFEFCWLCLKNHNNHSDTCNKLNQDQLEKARNGGGDLKKIEYLIRFNHYHTRYIEHHNAIEYAIKKKQKFQDQTEAIIQQIGNINKHCFQIILDVTDIILKARKCICFSYPLGYFLKGESKIAFYEFLQGELERYLEILDQKTDVELTEFALVDDQENPQLLKFSEEVSNLAGVVQMHFQRSIDEMKAGFPYIEETMKNTPQQKPLPKQKVAQKKQPGKRQIAGRTTARRGKQAQKLTKSR